MLLLENGSFVTVSNHAAITIHIRHVRIELNLLLHLLLGLDITTQERYVFVAAFVYHYLALQTLVALSSEAPDPVLANFTKRSACESLRLVLVAIDHIDFAPSSGSTAIYVAVLASTLSSRTLWNIGEYVNNQFGLFV